MIITDVIKVSAPPKFQDKDRLKGKIDNAKDLVDALKHRDTYRRFGSSGTVTESMQAELTKVRTHIWQEADALPNELQFDTSDPLTIAVRSPRIALDDIRSMADKLNFVVIPFAYLNDNAVKTNNDYKIQAMINGFVQKLPTSHLPYVLCPVGFYDIGKHVKAQQDLPLYAGEKNQQAFVAINMSVPIFRSMQSQLRNVDTRLQNVESNMQVVQTEMKNLSVRVEQLEKHAEQEMKKRLEAEAKLREMEKKLEEEKQARWLSQEPLLIGVPANVDMIDGEAMCVAGPCWGPDFKDIVFTLLNLKKVKGQRESLFEASKLWSLN